MTSVNIVELDKSFLTLFLILARTDSFGDLWGVGGAGIPPPSVGVKLAQIPVGARVKHISMIEVIALFRGILYLVNS